MCVCMCVRVCGLMAAVIRCRSGELDFRLPSDLAAAAAGSPVAADGGSGWRRVGGAAAVERDAAAEAAIVRAG
jgi:hypothetical protein